MIIFDTERQLPVPLLDLNQELGKNYIMIGSTEHGTPIGISDSRTFEVLPPKYTVLVSLEVD